MIELSLRRPVFAWVLMFSFIAFGVLCAQKLGISQMPDVDFPILNISVAYEGAAPDVVEADLIDPIEERLLTIEGIKEMRSSARQGSGSVTLEFDINRNVDVALQEVQSALSQLRLPPGVDPAVIRKQNPEEDPIIILGIYGDVSLKDMLAWADTFLLNQIQFIPGVGEVSVGGFSQRSLRIWLDVKKLEQYYLTIDDVVEALRTQHVESAAGQFSEGKRELRVRWMGEATTEDEVRMIRILKRGGQFINDREILIKDVAQVEDGLTDVRRIGRVEGKQAVGVQIRKQRGTNEVEVAQAVREHLEKIKDRFPPGFQYRVNVDFTRPTKATVHLTIEKLLMAAAITILVCFLFLGSFQAAINILFSIPVSIVGTFIFLYFAGFTLNLFTLLALTLAISIVVDDAIMLLENIVRHYRMGKTAFSAALDGAREVMPAASAATFAVVAVFLPVIFMDGIIGKFFLQFGLTMSVAVLISLLEAVTITPMRSAAFFRAGKDETGKYEKWVEHKFEHYSEIYGRTLAMALKYKWSILLGSIVFFVVSMALITRVRQEFVPAQDQDILIVQGQAPAGSSLEFTDQLSRKIEVALNEDPDVQGFFMSVGAGGPNAQVNQIFVPVTLKPKDERKSGHIEIMDRFREKFKDIKGLRVNMRDISTRNLTSGRQNPLAISLRGPDLKVLNDKAEELMKKLEEEKIAVDLDTDYRAGIPELLVEPNRRAMALRGVSIDAVGQVLAAGVGGIRQGRYTADGRRYDIRFKILDSQIRSPDDFFRIFVRNNQGNLVPLGELAKISESSAPQSINRVNRARAVSVFGNLGKGLSQAKVLDRTQQIAKEILPPGYSYALEGAAAGFSSSFESLRTALLMGILVAFLILAVQFNSFIHPISVLMALPFSLTGALVTLWIFSASLNIFSFIGLIVLMGIAKKNSIMLVEFTNQVRHGGIKDVKEALVKACPVRLRPIIMTSMATVAAALPLVIGGGIGSETRQPMGLAIIGGTIVSTILTLYVIPVLYLLLSRFESNQEQSLATGMRGK